MQFSHSRLECFESCPFKFQLRYINQITTIPSDDPSSPLILGHALHTGIEQGTEAGVNEYLNAYPVITDLHINEQIKLEYWIPRVRKLIHPEAEFEVPLHDPDFTGFIDLLTPALGFHDQPMPGLYDLVDFKYASSASRYAESEQLHLYKYYFEKLNPGKFIRNLTYWVIPKVSIKQKSGEDLQEFRRRIEADLNRKEIQFVEVKDDPNRVINFLTGCKRCIEAKEFPEKHSYLCNWCEYQEYCQRGEDWMLLPKNERRDLTKITKKVLWIYGKPFSGKTWFANRFPDPLMLNTDGNIKYVDSPFISIRDEVTSSGRMTTTKLGWEVFKDVIDELAKKQNEFKTIIVDLLEDTYEMCRLYMYKEMGITHESDDSFRAWDKVRTEFLSTMRKLVNLDYENIILISHEDTSRDIMKKGGDKITAIKPNMQDKVANKIAGMVDLVTRLVSEGDTRKLTFKNSETVFGGGRLIVKEDEINADYDEFISLYAEANANAAKAMNPVQEAPKPVESVKDVDKGTGAIVGATPEEQKAEEAVEAAEPVVPVRKRKTQEEALAEQVKEAEQTPDVNTTAEVPVRRTRKKREE